MELPATVYARFSSLEQSKGSSVVRQIEHCSSFAQQQGWRIDDTVIDEGRSAFSGVNRSQGALLFEFERKAAAGHFANGHVLICEHLDRISRQGWEEVYAFLKAMTTNGVTVATVDGSRIYGSGERVQMAQVMEIIIKAELAWEESSKKSRRIQASWKSRLDDIRGGSRKAITRLTPAWIAVADDGTMSVIPERASVLREMFEWSAAGLGGPTIVRRLNERAEPTWGRATEGWQLGYVTKLLTNRATVGEYQPMKRSRHQSHREAVPSGEAFLDYYPAAIDADLFDRVQQGRASRRGTGGKRGITQANLFSGIATYGHCGGRMTYGSTRKKGNIVHGTSGSRKPIIYTANTDHSFLQCDNSRRGVTGNDGQPCWNRAKVRYEFLEPAVLSRLLALAFDESNFEVADDVALLRVEMAEAERQIEDRRQRLTTLIEAFSRTGSPALEQAVLTLENEIEDGGKALAKIGGALAIAKGTVGPEEHLRRVRAIRDAIVNDDPAVRLDARIRVHQALRGIITRMTCDAQRSTSIWLARGLAFLQFDGQGRQTADIVLPARVRPEMAGQSLSNVLAAVKGAEGNEARTEAILKRWRHEDAQRFEV